LSLSCRRRLGVFFIVDHPWLRIMATGRGQDSTSRRRLPAEACRTHPCRGSWCVCVSLAARSVGAHRWGLMGSTVFSCVWICSHFISIPNKYLSTST
jgi:hypothetical protein